MKIGYPCINLGLDCRSSRTFRLASYSQQRFRDTVVRNLECLLKILQYNAEHGFLFFRITSDLIPFASHPVCDVPWQKEFEHSFAQIGLLLKQSGMRLSMHPDQFVLINSTDDDIFDRSVHELVYQAEVLDLMNAKMDAKVQIHVGGVYGDKKKSISRFIVRYRMLPDIVKRRLVVENDERLYTVDDCMSIYRSTRIPIVLDVFHHSLNNNGEKTCDAFHAVTATWRKKDGIPIVDYSTQEKGRRPGSHAQAIDARHFRSFLQSMNGYDFDIMLEIKNKEESAHKAIKIVNEMKKRQSISRIQSARP